MVGAPLCSVTKSICPLPRQLFNIRKQRKNRSSNKPQHKVIILLIHCVSDKEIKIISQDSQVCQLNQQYTGEEKIITFYAISCSSFAGNINFLGFGDGSLCFYEFLVVIKTMIPTHNRPLELFSLLKNFTVDDSHFNTIFSPGSAFSTILSKIWRNLFVLSTVCPGCYTFSHLYVQLDG